ncbi:hypothetical protein [Thiomicrospira sp. WB1]|uniref:hypothetical protein n=1 Tax=Thiomicrospira sp. WB1 TaxID=1685380 RepID=UPI000839A69A|nr:hypothetical protein [Thiomicrospira sp. WB1]
MTPIWLNGLPGAGKTRWRQAAVADGLKWIELSQPAVPSTLRPDELIFCVVDARAEPPAPHSLADQWLRADLSVARGVIMSFAEQADLMQQQRWQAWLKTTSADSLPRHWWLSQTPPSSRWLLQWLEAADKAATPEDHSLWQAQRERWQSTWRVEAWSLSSINAQPNAQWTLEGLLAGLDAARHNLCMCLLRVEGEINTVEYDNRVAIEGDYQRVVPYAADSESPESWLRVSGMDLDHAWLAELIRGCVV